MPESKNRNSRKRLPPILRGRRSFIKTLVVGGTTLTVGMVSPLGILSRENEKEPEYSMILVDFDRCTGCRTCETVCSQYNHRVEIAGQRIWGLGNPYLSNIRVYPFNPDADVPVVCVMCRDNPCVEACPVGPDENGHKALYRHPDTLAVTCNEEKCIACGSCADACAEIRVGAIIPHPETNRPQRMCTLCDGDPQCVKYCPHGALTHLTGGLGGKHYGQPPGKIAEDLIRRWYGSSRIEAGEIR
jgi:Fe-S-cluster-containing hydrogenase component 2